MKALHFRSILGLECSLKHEIFRGFRQSKDYAFVVTDDFHEKILTSSLTCILVITNLYIGESLKRVIFRSGDPHVHPVLEFI